MSDHHDDGGAQQAAAYLGALRKHLESSGKALDLASAEIHEDNALSAHVRAMDAYLQNLAKARRSEGEGSATRLGNQPELDRLWRAAQTKESHDRVKAWHARRGDGAPFGREWLRVAFPMQPGAHEEWEATLGPLGTSALRPLLPIGGEGGGGGGGEGGGGTPSPPPPPHAPPPLHVCIAAPYALSLPTSSSTGVADLETRPQADPASGNVSVVSMTSAPVLAGGGTDSRALLGGTVSWGTGFGLLTLSASITLGYADLFAMTTLGGATASAELLITATLSDGRTIGTTLGLGAAVAPLLWETTVDVPGSYTVTLSGIPVNGAAGSARVLAGIHDNTAAVGVAGAAGAITAVLGTINSICADLR